MAADPIIHGMILAAGFGTRLLPVTEHLPKPLLPVGEATLLDHAVAAFDRAGIGPVAVNSHHHSEKIEKHLNLRPDADRFFHSPEREILGTGGALDGARDFLAVADHFVVFNGDVLCNVDLKSMVDNHLESGRLATLLLVDRPRINSVFVAEDGAVIHIRGAGPEVAGTALIAARGLTYSGIGVFSAKLLGDIESGFSSLIDPLVRAVGRRFGCVAGWTQEGVFWDDLGTLPRYLEVCHRIQGADEEFGWLKAEDGLPPGPLAIQRFTGHGSDRRFWRLKTDRWSAVAMQSDPGEANDDEFRRHLIFGEFLHRHDLGSAEVFSSDLPSNTALMEDLGQASLFFLHRNPGTPPQRLHDRYRQSVDHLLRLQAFTETARRECPLLVDRCLDTENLLWETGYFKERFLVGHCGLSETELAPLESEFSALADKVANQPQVLLHRDYQSQNIHFKAGKVRLVDFQGMRLGPLGYDLMSLLMDPYRQLEAPLFEELLDRFCVGQASAPEETRAMALAAGLQRLMQALGAYGFLGHVKGKTEFLEHIDRGVAHLLFVLDRCEILRNEHPAAAQKWLPVTLEHLHRQVQRLAG